MEIEIKVISTEIIKPSSPTPKSLQKHYLSFLDQLAPPFFMPLVYFYSSNPKIPNSQISDHLKKSLSETLSRFYPLAGRLADNLHVDCNDGGAPFSEAEADCDLSQVITNPNPKDMNKFLPFSLNPSLDFCMAAQATYFRCGGVAVGLLISHKIADALSIFTFANSWSAAARGGTADGPPLPKFDAAAYFPAQDIRGYKASTGMMKEELASKIFTFHTKKIAILRDRYAAASGSGVGVERRPTRVEALSAFIWSRFISSTGMRADPNKIYTVQHAVNLRTRTDPVLPEYHFGNISRVAIAKPAVGSSGVTDGGVELVRRVREAIKAVDGGFVARLREGGEHLDLMKERMALANKGELVSFSFTSLCRFPVYEADFGWGKPVWVGSAEFAYKNLVIFMDTRDGDGIEAWVNLRREDMEKFEADLELQDFLSHHKNYFNFT
ncbi:stemmadenine O-acetyltransferase-like [Salvia miltiorrhiza]|uniref:stemmadenine O-acetyltransferase-like n=1 Tax=Salvia miltiorrhiza TaxID=226208 RepID=UPI0025AD5497|nr:stemmadenine O-acetyltransferase-like [Salvia miltiorrhiza]